jgi:hypothetical protein
MTNQTQFEKFAATTGKGIEEIEAYFHEIGWHIENEWAKQIIEYSMNCEQVTNRNELPILIDLDYQKDGGKHNIIYRYFVIVDNNNEFDFYVV